MPALPESAAWPGLQHRHGGEQQAEGGQDLPAEVPRLPVPYGQRDQQAGHAVEHDRAGSAQQERQAGREDPAERLTEYPDD